MRVRRSTFLIATMVAATLSLACAGAALADAGSGETSASATAASSSSSSSSSSTSTTSTSSKTPTDTSTKPPTDTKAPVTEVPKTTTPTPVTEAPKTPPATTPVPACADTSSCVTTPEDQELPQETCADTPGVATTGSCAPTTPDTRVVPDAPGGGNTQLPFTGPGDVVLAIVLALLAGSGGILFMFGAAGREQLDTLNRRGMDSPSGFHLAYRELRKDQLDR
ncbi:MAG: hypothetical protein JWL76_189 [Thermoleophilia bacterium]|nr:hypothetical protein [Thermoleophilia bacterium]